MGASSGKYYAAVVIPDDFSRDMLRFYMDDSERAQITYYSNEKKNAISPKITATGADTVSEKVNTVFAQSISEVMLSVAESISRYADDMDLHGQVAALAEHVDSMSGDINRVADVVGMYAGTLQSAQRLLDSGAELIRQAEDEVRSMMGTASDSVAERHRWRSRVDGCKGKMDTALSDAQASFDALRQQFASSELAQFVDPTVQQRIDQMIADAQAKIQAVRDDYDATLKPDLDRLVSDVRGWGPMHPRLSTAWRLPRAVSRRHRIRPRASSAMPSPRYPRWRAICAPRLTRCTSSRRVSPRHS